MKSTYKQVSAVYGATFTARLTGVEVLGQNEDGLYLRFASKEQQAAYEKLYQQASNGALIAYVRVAYRDARRALKEKKG